MARDFDLLRRAVGDENLTYVGYSYGTYLGATYANMFPDKVRALVLDGMVDPEAYRGAAAPRLTTAFVRQGSDAGSSKTLHAFFSLCADSGARCAFGAGGDPEEKFADLTRRLDKDPVRVPIPGSDRVVEFGYDELVAVTVQLLYSPQAWSFLAGFLQQVYASDDPAGAVRRLLTVLSTPRQEYVNTKEAQLASICVDTQEPGRPSAWPHMARKAARGSPHVGPLWTYITLPCATWHAEDEDGYTGPFDRRTSAPVLIIGTKYDPATPYRNAVNYAAELPRGRLLTLDGYGHTSLLQSDCVDEKVTKYLVNGVLPAPGTVCETDVVPFTPVRQHLRAPTVPFRVPLPALPGLN